MKNSHPHVPQVPHVQQVQPVGQELLLTPCGVRAVSSVKMKMSRIHPDPAFGGRTDEGIRDEQKKAEEYADVTTSPCFSQLSLQLRIKPHRRASPPLLIW